MHKIFTSISCLFISLLFSIKVQAQAPTIKAVPANRVTYFGANLNALVNPSNDSTTISFEYGLTAAYGDSVAVSGKFTGNTTLFKTIAVTNLIPGQIYHYRAKAVNGNGATYGKDLVFSAGSNFSKSANGGHTLTVGSDGIVYAVGPNDYGQLGDNTTTRRTTPVKVLKGAYSGTTYLGDNINNPIIAVVTGAIHSLAIAADGTVYAFGYNNTAQLGDNTTTDKHTPIKVLKGAYSGTTYLGDNANNPIISVSGGTYHSMALAADGSMYAFGNNNHGQLGDNTTNQRNTAIKVLKGAYSGTTYLGDNSNNPIISIAAGDVQSLALTADGLVYGFGNNWYGQLGDNTVASKYLPTHVLKGTYSGTTYLGDKTNNPIIAISAGYEHSATLAADGSIYAFGRNAFGELGDNSNNQRNTPVRALKGAYSGTTYLGDKTNKPIISLAAGDYHTLALAVDGSVYAFGYNQYGELGDNTTTNHATPIRVLKGAYNGSTYLGDDVKNTITAISTGSNHCIAMAANGSVFTFGFNGEGQLGDNSYNDRATPIFMMGVGAKGFLDLINAPVVKAVPANRITYDGANLNVLINPSNDSTTISFEYGLTTTYGNSITLSGKYIDSISLFKTAAITGLAPGRTYHYRAKAVNAKGTTYGSDRIFSTGSSFSVSNNGNHTLTVADDGTVYAFGKNAFGQLGDSTNTTRTTPLRVEKGAYNGATYLGDDTNNPIILVSAGYYHSLALAADGSVYAFGYNGYGELGDNTTNNRIIPIQVVKGAYNGSNYLGDNSNNPIISVTAGQNFSIALAANGSVYTFGRNNDGQLGDSSTTDRHEAVKVVKGAYKGDTYLGDDVNNPIVAVSPGAYHSIALTADGSVYTFGRNNYGQLGDNTTTDRITPIQVIKGAYNGNTYLGDTTNNPVISVSAGLGHSLALAADGMLYAFGYNNLGQLGDSSTTDKATPILVKKGAYNGSTYLGDNNNNPISTITAGQYHNLALAADGSVYAFGRNDFGQLGDNTTTQRNRPVQVAKGAYNGSTYLGDSVNNPIITLAAGEDHSIALASDGLVYTFGYNFFGQLGENSNTSRTTPTQAMGVGASGVLDLICESTSALSITACNNYLFNGDTLSNSGIYYDTLTNTKNCDSIITLNLTIKTNTQTTATISACYSYLFNGSTITTSGVYYDTLTNATGCDSMVTLNLTINNSSANTATITACDHYTFNGNSITSSGIYYDTLSNALGCDSIITLNLTINNSSTNAMTATACDHYTFKGNNITSSGIYYDTLTNAIGCDSIITLNLTIYPSSTNTLTIAACNQFTFKGNVITSSGIYYDTLSNAFGCDSIITLNLTINNGSANTLNIVACNQFMFNANTITASGIYYDTLANAKGCDSIITLNLTINNSTANTLNIAACDHYTFKGNTITSSGIYDDTLTNAAGCDSIITLNLTINKSSANTLNITACDQFIFKGNGITSSGVYYDTLSNATGCDSIITLNLTINKSSTNALTMTACDQYIFKGNTITSSGVYNDTLINATGCDSIISLYLTINNSTTNTTTMTACDQYIFKGNTITSSGVYYDSLASATGCDSINILNLIINKSNASSINATITQGNSYTFGGKNLTIAGTYYDTLQNAVNCDSIVTLVLVVNSGIAKATTENVLIVYPNPTNELLYIQTSTPQVGKEIMIYNVIGELIYKDIWKKGETIRAIDVSKFANGMYIIMLGDTAVKVIKE
jgi:alpha-tubulin suppressor-like RCC1 family protein